MELSRPLVVAALVSICARSSVAQVCGGAVGPNIVVGGISAPSNYPATAGLDAVAFGTTLCNFGTQTITVQATTPNHPIVMQNLYRLESVNGALRFEQIGMSWVWQSSFMLETNSCCSCAPSGGGNLGPGCSSDSSSNSLGAQLAQAPRTDVDAFTATFPYPGSNPPFSGAPARRLQFAVSDVDPSLHPGATYFVEEIALAPGDAAAGNALDDWSYAPVSIAFAGGEATLAISGAVVRGQPAIQAWYLADSSVQLTTVQVPGEGSFVVGSRATPLSSGAWHYEYAVENLDSDLSCGAVEVAITNPHVDTTNAGFHDVAYHDGDGPGGVTVDGADWPSIRSSTAIRWSTTAFATNPGANALRAATLYDFRFDAPSPPAASVLHLETWKSAGSIAVPVPAPGTISSPATPLCFGDGSGAACPCGNTGLAGRGCDSSAHLGGGALIGDGTPSLAHDTFSLLGEDMNFSSCLYFQGFTPINGGLGIAFGDGLRCAGGGTVRLAVRTNFGGLSTYGFLHGDTPVSVRGNVTAPGARVYQAWYRDAQTFCTSATYNLTNALSVNWTP